VPYIGLGPNLGFSQENRLLGLSFHPGFGTEPLFASEPGLVHTEALTFRREPRATYGHNSVVPHGDCAIRLADGRMMGLMLGLKHVPQHRRLVTLDMLATLG
jgi:hypothetical protein